MRPLVRAGAETAAWAAVIALAAWSTPRIAGGGPDAPSRASLPERLLGPFAALAADVQWVRFDAALRAGRDDVAYARAETALELAPSDPGGWIFLAHHLVFDRGSPERESDPEVRRRWIEAGLAVLERGAGRCRDARELVFYEGLVHGWLASLLPEHRPWVTDAREAWRAAAEAFDRAARLGHPLAADAAASARQRAAE